jgi:hypothetical protein
LLDELLVLPAILEDVPEQAINHRDVGARPYPHKVGRVCSRARHPRIHDDHVRAVELFAFQHMLQRHGVRLGWIAAQDQHGLGVTDIVEAVGHRAVDPGIGQAGDGGGMADTCVIDELVPQNAATCGKCRHPRWRIWRSRASGRRHSLTFTDRG